MGIISGLGIISGAVQATCHHVFLRMVGEVKMSRDWFGNVFIIDRNISKVFAGTVTKSAARFADVYFFA